MTWSAGLSREAAISSGRRSCLRPSIVAWATLMPFEEPSDLAMMSFTPAISRIARAAPPAMTPVPGAAGFFGLAVAESDAAVAVTDHHQRGEGEPTSTLHDLRDAIHLDGALFVLFYVSH